jgi:flagellar biosynthesis chaperone FliJ
MLRFYAVYFHLRLHNLTLPLIKEGKGMPYHKNKQQAFQAAQQGVEDVEELYYEIVQDSASYGHQLKHLKNEVNEAYQQIENALEVASEKQRAQLEQFQTDLEGIVNSVNETP